MAAFNKYQHLQNYIHQYRPKIAFWLVFSTFLYKKFCLNIGHWKITLAKADVPMYRKVSYIRHTQVGNKIVDHSDVVGASPAAPTASSFST